jgi:hypothetical protein
MVDGARAGFLGRLAAFYLILADFRNSPGVTPTTPLEDGRLPRSLHTLMEVLVTRAYKRHGGQRSAGLETCAVVFLRSL